ncbi:hypothetical protein [Kosmotoga pacifica]|uniref:Fibronectin type-III domain-containing protein n=1 Tax=Kosmotoga pacifica TaxID=1330330 RepID=A0A0G2Z621_9BACT|nr:hypothetical protein [Kosmotoga pacifica]AKI96987.1 hypothetical protein IX53_03170 [Kosmotoga pacifica]
MKRSLIFLLIMLTAIALAVDYSATSPFPKDGAVILPFNGEARLSWSVNNPYGKTLIYYLNVYDGENSQLFGPLTERSFSFPVKPGKTYSWKVKTVVYDEEYWSSQWEFHVPKTFDYLFGGIYWEYPVDAKIVNDEVVILGKRLNGTSYEAYQYKLSEEFNVVEQRFLGAFTPTDFWKDGILGYENTEAGKVPIFCYDSGSTETIFPGAFSSIQLLKGFDNTIIFAGRSNTGTFAFVKKGEELSKIKLGKLSLIDATVVGGKAVFVGSVSEETLNFPVVVIGSEMVLKWRYQGWLLRVVSGETDRFFYVLGIVPTPTNDYDVVLRKYTTDGIMLWSKTIDDFRDEIPGDILLLDDRICVLESVYDEGYKQRIFLYSFDGEPMGILENKTEKSEKPLKLLKIEPGFLTVGYSYEPGSKTQIAVRFFSKR